MKIVAWKGRLDARQLAELNRSMDPVQGERRIGLDLSQVTGMDAAVFGLLASLVRQAWSWHGKIVVLSPSAELRRLFSESGFDQAVEFQ